MISWCCCCCSCICCYLFSYFSHYLFVSVSPAVVAVPGAYPAKVALAEVCQLRGQLARGAVSGSGAAGVSNGAPAKWMGKPRSTGREHTVWDNPAPQSLLLPSQMSLHDGNVRSTATATMAAHAITALWPCEGKCSYTDFQTGPWIKLAPGSWFTAHVSSSRLWVQSVINGPVHTLTPDTCPVMLMDRNPVLLIEWLWLLKHAQLKMS